MYIDETKPVFWQLGTLQHVALATGRPQRPINALTDLGRLRVVVAGNRHPIVWD